MSTEKKSNEARIPNPISPPMPKHSQAPSESALRGCSKQSQRLSGSLHRWGEFPPQGGIKPYRKRREGSFCFMRAAENSDGSQKTEANHFPSMKITVRAHLELTKMLDLETCPKRWIPLMGFFIKAPGDSAALSQPQLCSPRGVPAARSLRGLPLSRSLFSPALL